MAMTRKRRRIILIGIGAGFVLAASLLGLITSLFTLSSRLESCLERGGLLGPVLLGESVGLLPPPALLTMASISFASVYSCSLLLSVSARSSLPPW